eukprot:TRINITY_DN13894_c0_g2_i2.p2 TRINITY_DN13894_c0_g2~~TRINITY_DN13894_c0_g2_i2.p2  ORF type:complete len:128 (-),score=3.35 TRINITY_DN13894_c0_g2_i2:41-424(-)
MPAPIPAPAAAPAAPYQKLRDLIARKPELNKFGNWGRPHRRPMTLRGNKLYWKNDASSFVYLSDINGVVRGWHSKSMFGPSAAEVECCFTIFSNSRPLHLQADDPSTCEAWTIALEEAMKEAKMNSI